MIKNKKYWVPMVKGGASFLYRYLDNGLI